MPVEEVEELIGGCTDILKNSMKEQTRGGAP